MLRTRLRLTRAKGGSWAFCDAAVTDVGCGCISTVNRGACGRILANEPTEGRRLRRPMEGSVALAAASGKEVTMVEKTDVAAVLELIRPSLQADGGDVKLVDVSDDGVVSVELQGACKGCPMSQMTLANGVERILKERVPGVTRVVPADLM